MRKIQKVVWTGVSDRAWESRRRVKVLLSTWGNSVRTAFCQTGIPRRSALVGLNGDGNVVEGVRTVEVRFVKVETLCIDRFGTVP